MANAERGEVGFEALGKSWVLRYSTNAMCEIEEALGEPILAIANQLQDESRVSIRTLRALFRHGVEGCEDLKHAGELMDAIGFADAGQLIGEAFTRAFPADDGGQPGKKQAARA